MRCAAMHGELRILVTFDLQPCEYTPPSTTMHSHRPTSATHSPSLLAYGQAPGQYEYVKVEEDSYDVRTTSSDATIGLHDRLLFRAMLHLIAATLPRCLHSQVANRR